MNTREAFFFMIGKKAGIINREKEHPRSKVKHTRNKLRSLKGIPKQEKREKKPTSPYLWPNQNKKFNKVIGPSTIQVLAQDHKLSKKKKEKKERLHPTC